MLVTAAGSWAQPAPPTAAAPAAVLERGPMVAGRVVDGDGEPLAGARVEVRPLRSPFEAGVALVREGESEPVAVATVATDSAGDFRLELPEPGMWEMAVLAEGFLPVRRQLAPLLGDAGLAPIQLRRSESLVVQVYGPEGQPLAGAWVAADYGFDRSAVRGLSWRSRLAWSQASAAGVSPAAGRRRTGADGRVKLESWGGVPIRLRAIAPGMAPATLDEVPNGAARLTMSPAALRQLKVVEAGGTPAAGVLVRLVDGDWPVAVTDDAGRAELWTATTGKTAIQLSARDGRSLEASLEPLPARAGSRKLRGAEGSAQRDAEPVVLELPAVAWLTGKVVAEENGRPLAAAWVFEQGREADFVRSDSAGRYRAAVAESGSVRLEAMRADRLPATVRAAARPGDQNTAPVLELAAAARIAGRAVDERQNSVAGVWIEANLRANEWADGGKIALSDADGRFALSGLAVNALYTLSAERSGFAPSEQEVATAGTGIARCELVMRPGRLGFGGVLDLYEVPIAGAEVQLIGSKDGQPFARGLNTLGYGSAQAKNTVTDTTGRFELPDLPPGRYNLSARARGFAPATVPGIEVPAGGGTTDFGTLLLEPGAVLEGQVVDLEDAPIAGAQVGVWSQSELFAWSTPQGEERMHNTDDNGSFAVGDLRPGDEVMVQVSHPGYVAYWRSGVEVPSAEPLRVTLRPTSTLRGVVLDTAGEAVAQASVEILPQSASPFGGRFGGGRATTDEEGRFEATEIAPGPVSLTARAEGFLPTTKPVLEVPEGAELEGIELVLERGAVIVGTVRSSAGEAVTEGQVGLVEDDLSWAMQRGGGGAASIEADGSFRLEGVPRGSISLEAQVEGFGRAVKDLEVREGENRVDLVVEPTVRVTGRVVDPFGRPAAGASVDLLAASSHGSSSGEPSGVDGSFEIQGVEDGDYEVVANHPDYGRTRTPQVITVAGAEVAGLEVWLSETAVITGRILGVELDSLPSIEVLGTEASRQSFAITEADYEGRYRLTGVMAGDWTVMALNSLTGANAQGQVSLAEGQREATLDLEFVDGFTLSGTVLRDAEPVAGLQVLAAAASGNAGGRDSTDQAGRFEISGLQEGSYELRVLDPGLGVRHAESVELAGDRELEIELVEIRVRGRVVDGAAGGGVPAATVQVERIEEDERLRPGIWGGGVLSGDDGRFSLGELMPGRWRVSVEKEGYERAAVEVEVASVPVDDLEIEMRPGGGLTFYVAHPRWGAPQRVEAAVVDNAALAIVSGTYATREGGRVYLAGVPSGSWNLLVASGSSAVVSAAVTVPGSPPRLTLADGGTVWVVVPELVGQPARATLRLIGADGRAFSRPVSGLSDLSRFRIDTGRATVEALPAGSWLVEVTTDDGRSWNHTAQVAPGATAEVRLE